MHRHARSAIAAFALMGCFVAPATAAQDSILAPGPTPLTRPMMDTLVEATELLMELEFTAQDRARFQDVMIREWATNPEVVQSTVGLMDQYPQLRQVPERKLRLAIRANLLNYLVNLDRDSKRGDATSKVLLDVYLRNHPGVIPEAPLFSKNVADAYIDGFVFIGELKSGKPAPKISDAERQNLRKRMAKDYANFSPQQREEMAQKMHQATLFRIQWPELQPHEKLLVRAEVGAKLSPDEQMLAMQVRQMMTSHSLRMMTSELNSIQANQQLIMGSAPYFNHSTQRWERIGGINTEFH